MSKTRKVYIGIEGKVYEAPEKVARLAAKSGEDVKISPPIDVLEAHFSNATIKSIKQMLAGEAAFTLKSDEDIERHIDEVFGKQDRRCKKKNLRSPIRKTS